MQLGFLLDLQKERKLRFDRFLVFGGKWDILEAVSEISQILIRCLKTCYLIEAARVELLPLGADMNASVYKVQGADQKSYFVKVRRGHPDDASFAILELLQSAGIQEIIFPIRTIRGDLTQKFEDFTLIVYPFIEGQDGFSRPLSSQQWIQLGKILRQIHKINVPQSIQSRIRREGFSPKWRDSVRALYSQIETIQASDPVGRQLLIFLKENQMTIQQLVNPAERLGQTLQTKAHESVLCHSDLHGGNILLSGGGFHIVDWDDPIMAPKERDLMFIGGGVGNVWNLSDEEALFYEGYGNARIDRALLAYYRLERIVEDMAIYAQELLMNGESNTDREKMYRHFAEMFEPRGVVDLAFEAVQRLGV